MQTIFDDHSFAPATPNSSPVDTERAHVLGYNGDTWSMTLDHELLHTWVAERLGRECSVVLWNVAHGKPKPHGGLVEEGYVTSIQRFLRCGDLDDLVHGFLARAHLLTGLPRDELVRQARDLLAEVRTRD
jgi:hypothetical protein